MDLSRFTPEAEGTPVAPRPTRAPSWWWERLELSPNTHRSFAHTAPRLRGWLHRVMAALWPLLVVVLAVEAPTTTAVVGVVVFGVAMQAMFSASAVTHLRRWPVWSTELLFRLDHVGIFVAIAGTLTPIALLALDGWMRPLVLVAAWTIAIIGTLVVLHPARTPVGFGNSAFIGAGAIVIPFAPVLAGRLDAGGLVLLATGAATYVVGALLLAYQRPVLSPRVFGYHEVWHALVVLGVLQHTAMIRWSLLPLA